LQGVCLEFRACATLCVVYHHAAWSCLQAKTARRRPPRAQARALAPELLPGTLPLEWRFQSNLTLIDLSGNRLEGQLPAGWADLKQLQLLDLSANQLSGGREGHAAATDNCLT
jgi:hypothetical protein